MQRHVPAVVFITVASFACGGRVIPATSGSVAEPRASWRISAGTEFGSEKEVCRSDRLQPCVIAASASGTPTHATVSVYLYPAANEQTTYRGAFLSSFLGGRGHETQVDYSIKPGERGNFVTSSGVVTSVPGEYEFRMALFADVAGQSDPHQFDQSIPVRVTNPKGSS